MRRLARFKEVVVINLQYKGRSLFAVCWALLACAVTAIEASAQPSGTPVIRDSSVGYIDPAIPGDVLRLRFDDTFDKVQPSRAEFFYPRAGAAGPGPILPETSVDYQEVSAYAELAWTNRLSYFLNVPVRFLNPEINSNSSGFSDIDAGFKYALVYTPTLVATTQLRVYAPTGHAREGLGTQHVSIEPALLLYRSLTQRLGLEAEVRNWIPIDGTDFAGGIFRYGVGLNYWLPLNGQWQITPVAEVVGWTVTGGKSSVPVAPGEFLVEDAQGTTIVNSKLGVRTRFTRNADIYAGWGHALTDESWYENTYRVEFRLSF
jgi:hypothetical protein